MKEHLKKKFKIDNCINPNVGTNHTSRRFFTIRNDLMKDYKLQRVSLRRSMDSIDHCLHVYFSDMMLRFTLSAFEDLFP